MGHGWNPALGLAADLQMSAAFLIHATSNISVAALMWTALSRRRSASTRMACFSEVSLDERVPLDERVRAATSRHITTE